MGRLRRILYMYADHRLGVVLKELSGYKGEGHDGVARDPSDGTTAT